MESAEGGGPRPALASQADAGAGVARDLAAVEERSPGGSGSSSAEEEEEDATAPLQRVPSFDLEAGGDARAHVRGSGGGGGGGAGPSGRRRRIDPDTAAQHTYLGDVEELTGGGSGLLEEGAAVTLPLFALEGVVLLPGASLPLILHSRPDVLKLERALRAGAAAAEGGAGGAGGTSRLIAVTHIHRHLRSLCLVGCSAEVRRLRRHWPGQEEQEEQAGAGGHQPPPAADAAAAAAAGTAGGAAGGYVVSLVARGRQRLLLEGGSLADSFRVRCRVLPEGLAEAPPRQMSSGAGHWAPWALRPFDAPALAAAAQRLCSAVLPQIAGKLGPGAQAAAAAAGGGGGGAHHGCGTSTSSTGGSSSSSTAVRQYTYWLGANLPLHDDQRQQLLEARDTPQRLRLLLGWLRRLGALACRECGSQVTTCSSALLVSAEGAGGAFVNAHGYVHDMATFRSVQGLRYIGRSETAHSWFPGFAWTIANCAACGEHLGWRFTAVSPGLSPHVFWGLRRTAIMCPELYGSSNSSTANNRRTAAAAARRRTQPPPAPEQQPAAAAGAAAAERPAGRLMRAAAAAAAARAAGGGQVDAAAAVVRALLAMDRREQRAGGGGGGGSSEEEDSEEEETEEDSEEEDGSSGSSDWGDFDTAREVAGGMGLGLGAVGGLGMGLGREAVQGAAVPGGLEGEAGEEGEGGGVDYDGEYWSGDERGAWEEQEEGEGEEEEEEAEEGTPEEGMAEEGEESEEGRQQQAAAGPDAGSPHRPH